MEIYATGPLRRALLHGSRVADKPPLTDMHMDSLEVRAPRGIKGNLKCKTLKQLNEADNQNPSSRVALSETQRNSNRLYNTPIKTKVGNFQQNLTQRVNI